MNTQQRGGTSGDQLGATPLKRALLKCDFATSHQRRVAAPPDLVWEALHRVRLVDMRIARPIVALRSLGLRPVPMSPLLEDGPVKVLEERPPGYVIGAMIARPWQARPEHREVESLEGFGAFREPGWTKVLTDFELVPKPGGRHDHPHPDAGAVDERRGSAALRRLLGGDSTGQLAGAPRDARRGRSARRRLGGAQRIRPHLAAPGALLPGMFQMKLPNSAHTSTPWRVHALAYDFVLEDVWKLPTPRGPRDLDRIVRWFADDQGELSAATRVLFAIRWRLGGLLGWDTAESGVGSRVRSVRGRLPEDLARGPRGPDTTTLPFTSVFQTDDEWVAEMSNSTVHALLHLGWIEDAPGSYHAQMAVLVKPNGWLGRTYMAAILPARRAIVYPSLLRTIGRDWRRSADQSAPRREEAAS